MVNECNVFYMGEKGLMTFDKKKIVFQHRDNISDAKEGLGIIKVGTLEDKGNYSFGVFENVIANVPVDYCRLSFFVNKGVPMQVFQGTYGDSILFKEVYKEKTTIRAYSRFGKVLLYENEIKKSEDYEGPNMYYSRINELVGVWEDFTSNFEKLILQDLKFKKCTVSLSNEKVQQALNGLSRNKIVRLTSGVIVAEGKFESLIIWGTDDDIEMTWLGRKLDLNEYVHIDITEDVINSRII